MNNEQFLYINGKLKRSPYQSDQFIAYSYNIDYQNQNYNVHNMQEAIDKLFSEIDALKNSSPVVPPTPQNLTVQINPNYQTTIPHPSTNATSYINIGISAKNSNNEEVRGSLSSISPNSGTGWSSVVNGKILTIYNTNDNTVTEPRIISKNSIQGTFIPQDTTLYNIVTNILLPPEDITLNPIQRYTLYFDVRGGSNPIEPISVIYGYSYTLPQYNGTLTGYSHESVWTYTYTGLNNTPSTATVPFGNKWKVNGNQNFYIDWKENQDNQDQCTLTIADATIYKILDNDDREVTIDSNSNNVWRPDLSNSSITLSELQRAVDKQGADYQADHRTTIVTLNQNSQYKLQLLAPPTYQFNTNSPIISDDYTTYISYVGNSPVIAYLHSYTYINSGLIEKRFINNINSSQIEYSGAAENTEEIEIYQLNITTTHTSGSFTLTPNLKLKETTHYYWYVGQTDPSTMTTISSTVDFNNGGGWTSTGESVPSTINQLVKGFDSTKEIFVAVPITNGTTLKPVTSDMSTIDTSVQTGSTKTLNGVNYQIYKYDAGVTRNTFRFAKK